MKAALSDRQLAKLIATIPPGYRWHVRTLLAESRALYRQAVRTATSEARKASRSAKGRP